MNRKIISALFAAAVCWTAPGQPANVYENDGLLLTPPAIPPNIDAINFLNFGQFLINFTNDVFVPLLPPPIGLPPFETQNTLHYYNFNGHLMSCNTGFRMEDFNSPTGLRQRAASFYNGGIIECGTTNTTNFVVAREFFFGT